MKRITQVALSVAAVILGGQVAQAQVNPGDLVLGFTSPGAVNDYVVDLGSVSALQAAGGTTSLGSRINMSVLLSTFGGSLNNVSAGVYYGVGNAAAGDYAGISVLGGGPVPSKPSGGNNVTAAATAANSTALGVVAVGNTLSFSYNASVSNPGTVANNLGLSPSQLLNGSTVVLDLYESARLPRVGLSTPASNFYLDGSLTLNFSGANALADFSPATAVPEPSTSGLLATAGLLALVLRRQFRSSAG
jgi:hypothetical protein